VSSVIGGFHQITEYTFEGLAPDVSFLLYKTEDVRSETHLEEDNWAAAAERAEMMGADIVSSSLGYSTFDAGEENYTYEDMDGETTIITRAANILTEYGVIVVTSAGNEGANSWNYITAPADGFDVIAVGAVYLDGKMAPFSSYGPTVDGRLKPEVVAPGVSVPCINNAGGLSYGSGTSLAAPVVTGGIALMLEMVPDMTMEEFREALFSTSSLSKLKDEPEEPDNRHGYGIPQFEELFDEIKPIHLPEIGQGMKIYPNPVSNRGNFFVSFSFPLQHNMQLEIYNILGQQVSVRSVMKGTLVAEITDSRFFQLPSGIYIISAQINGKRYSQKIVRIK